MISEFANAAFPWILLGLFLAISCSYMGIRQKKK